MKFINWERKANFKYRLNRKFFTREYYFVWRWSETKCYW